MFEPDAVATGTTYKAHKGRIEGWVVGPWFGQRQNVVIGMLYGHPDFKDGKHIRTSPVVKIDVEKGEVETRNSRYTLGKPARET